MHVNFVIDLVEQTRTPISGVVVVQGTVITGTIVPRQEFDDWLTAQFTAALEQQGYNVSTRSTTAQDPETPIVQGTANNPETFAMKDVTVREGSAVYHLPFLSVRIGDVGAFTIGHARS
jgi:hypothetical protein